MEKPTLKASDYGGIADRPERHRRFESSLSSSYRDRAIRLLLCLLLALTFSVVLLKRHQPPSLQICLANANISYLVSDSDGWAQTIQPWNTRLSYTPAAVAVPHSTDQIQAAVTCGINNHVRVSAKAGGHSFGSFGLGGEDGHLVIELAQLYGVTLHDDNTATVQPGARLGHVATELFNQGGRAIPHGACPGVGLAGHVLHGGYGRASRSRGLTLDWMIGAKVILANGSMVDCSTTKNADLFWALRGAGGSFGIVAEFTFDTFEAPPVVAPFTINLPFTDEKVRTALKELQDFAAVAPTELNMFLFVTTSSQVIQGLHFGDEVALRSVLQPLLTRLQTKISYIGTVGWLEGLEHYADGERLDQTIPYATHGVYYTSSLTTHALSERQLDSLVSTMFTNIDNATARHSWDIFFEMHGGKMSAVSQVNNSATAYPHRDKMLLWQFSEAQEHGTMPTEAFSNIRTIQKSVTDLMPPGTWGMYANFIDSEVDGMTAQNLYWGENLPRLRTIKSQIDPKNIFWTPQGISPLSYT